MIWIDSIYDLQYYKQTPGVPCYCEQVVYPDDMMLQGVIYNGSGSYSLKVYVYSGDGITQYEDATSNFNYYFAKNPQTGNDFFAVQLKNFSVAMCSYSCYILRIQVMSNGALIFDKYTERYCQTSCCDTARGVSYSQDDIVISGGGSDKPVATGLPAGLPADNCGAPLIKLTTRFDCVDKFTDEFYATPTTIYSGSASFTYTKTSTFKGRIVPRPREIKREISYNCKLQRSESAAQYLLEGFEYFPAWKMKEIEGQLHASYIYIDDFAEGKEYNYTGGTPFKQVSKCFELFKLTTAVEDCTQSQIFGCGDCNSSGSNSGDLYLSVPEAYAGGNFYSETKQLIANDYDGLLTYLRSQDGVTSVEDMDVSGLGCYVYKAVKVNAKGYVPKSVYYDAPIPRNRVFVIALNDVNDLCGTTGKRCRKPATGTITYTTLTCAMPVAGDITYTTLESTDVTVSTYGSWTINTGTSATLADGIVTLNLNVSRDTTAASGETIFIASEALAILSAGGRPLAIKNFSHSDNATIPEGCVLKIDPSGIITFSGSITATTDNIAAINISSLIYTI